MKCGLQVTIFEFTKEKVVGAYCHTPLTLICVICASSLRNQILYLEEKNGKTMGRKI